MTDEEILEIYEKMQKEYGEKLPNFVHEPKRFDFYCKLYRYTSEKEKKRE